MHLASGLEFWRFGTFKLHRVNPPLVPALAAAPVVLGNAEADWSRFSWHPAARTGYPDIIAANPTRWHLYFTMARWVLIPMSLAAAYVCYRWARELYGEWPGVLALTLWCFSPMVLGHAALITADVGAAASGVLAGYAFWRWLKSPAWSPALCAGLALGLAQLTKFTWIVLFGLWPILWIVWTLSRHGKTLPRRHVLRIAQLGAVQFVALLVLNLGYAFEGSFRPLNEYTFISPTLAGENVLQGNRFAGTWLGEFPVPLPKSYVGGIDLQRSDFEKEQWSYLRGEWRRKGWWYYYLYASAVKIPVGTWILGFVAGWISLTSTMGKARWPDEVVLLAPAVLVFVLVSSQTGFNRHFRYALPCLPFAFIWISKAAGATELRRPVLAVFGAAALAWSIASSLWIYPHSLSYFNELVGGPRHGHWHLINSNIDWGQDLFYLKEWIDQHPQARPLYVDSVMRPLLKPIGIAFPRPPAQPESGWFALSVDLLHDRSAGNYAWLLNDVDPVASVGYSIYIYHITPEDANRVRRKLGLPELPPEPPPRTEDDAQ